MIFNFYPSVLCLMKQYKVSVIIPLFNVERYIEKCAHSLFQQTLNSIQFVFINDCSTDNSIIKLKGVIKEYKSRMDDVLIINHERNRGAATARNTGLGSSLGKYIGWVDADDWIEKDMFETMLTMVENKGVDMVWCDYFLEYKDASLPMLNQVDNVTTLYINEMIKGNVQGMLWNKLFRSSIFYENNIRFIEGLCLGEDRLVVLKYLHYAHEIIYLPKPLYHYVQYNDISIVKDSNSKRFYEEIGNAELISEFVDDCGIDYISNEAMIEFKIRSKRRLLYSTNMADLQNWKIMLPEVNKEIFKTKELRFRHKVLAYLVENNVKFILKLWLFFKKNFGQKITNNE